VSCLACIIKSRLKENTTKQKEEREILKLRKNAEFYSIKTKLIACLKLKKICIDAMHERQGT